MKRPFSLASSFLLGLMIIFSFPALASAATYYVRADGTVTCANKANATSPDLASTSLSVLSSANGVNGCNTFLPGDTIYFSAKGGSYTAVNSAIDAIPTAIYIPQASGVVGNPINYIGLSDNSSTTTLANGATNNYPLVDVSAVAGGNGVTGGSAGIRVAHVNYVTVQNFNIKGSGGSGAAVFQMDNSSGTAGNGYTNVFTNINVLQGYGASTGNDDCFGGGSSAGENAQGVFNNIYASGCRPNPQSSMSDQCFTLHENAKAQINGMYCTDSNNGITDTLNTQLTATNITINNAYINVISAGGMTSSGYVTVTNSTFNVNGTGDLLNIPAGNGAVVVTISSSTINATAGGTGFVFGGIANFISNIWSINSSAFQEKAEAGGTINIIGQNIFSLSTTPSSAMFYADSGSPVSTLNISGATFNGGTGGGDLIANTGTGTVNAHNNIFTNFGGLEAPGWAFNGSGVSNWFNNTFYNTSKTGSAFRNQSPLVATINNKNNIFYNVANPCYGGDCGATGYTSSYNDYYNYTAITNPGAGSILTDPKFITPGTDFRLQPTSPAINMGTNVSLTSDFLGNSVPQGSAPDIGVYEFVIPSAPSSLAQYKADGTTNIASGRWTSDPTVVLKFLMSSVNGSDSLTPQVEIQPMGTAFTNITTNSGNAVAYSGSSVVGVVTIAGLSSGRTYHWQARVSNSVGTSSWSAMGGNPDFGVGSSDASLSNLTLSSGTLSPTFASSTTSYTGEVSNSVNSLTVIPTAGQASSTITVNGTTVTSGSTSIPVNLNVGNNIINIVVVAQDGSTTNTYTVNVARASGSVVSGSSSGNSVANQIDNLNAMGNTKLAGDLRLKYNLATSTQSRKVATLPRDAATITRTLSYKMTSKEVKLLQQFLNTHGFAVAKKGTGSLGHETTYFGLSTKAAVIKFQKANKIKPANGLVGPLTRKAILKLLSS